MSAISTDVGGNAAQHREDQALGALFPDETPSRSAERTSHAELHVPQRTASEHQVREVRAGYGQDECDQADDQQAETTNRPSLAGECRR